MRAASIAFVVLLASACGKQQPEPGPPPVAPQRSAEEEPVAAPTRPTPAFVPAREGSCASAYRLVGDNCVHRSYDPGSEPALAEALEAYKRGAAPPMLGVVRVVNVPEPSGPKQPSPGSLMRRGASEKEAGDAKEKRLAELDAMLTAAREKLAQRDEASKAKKVANPVHKKDGKTQPEAGDRAALDRFAQGVYGGSNTTGAPGTQGGADPRMGELSRIASQLSGDQLKALTNELSRSGGFNAGELEAILSEARTGETKP